MLTQRGTLPECLTLPWARAPRQVTPRRLRRRELPGYSFRLQPEEADLA
jgi:hypothetical protein